MPSAFSASSALFPANGPASEIEQLKAGLGGKWRQATRAVMVLLSRHELLPTQIATLLDCHPSTVRRRISRFNAEGTAGLAGQPRSGRPPLSGRLLTSRIAALLAQADRPRRPGSRPRGGPVTAQELNRPARSPRSVSRLRTCWAVRASDRCAVAQRMCASAEPRQQVRPLHEFWHGTGLPGGSGYRLMRR